ncbi:unnamed protein product [Linum trigynum]|uniref:Uncharacterized protein n=1 Tax=Linum trigynum TaxID=586398 RepID=A0AAV2GPF5_9ROSI
MHEILETDHVDESDDEGAVYKYYTAKASTKKERTARAGRSKSVFVGKILLQNSRCELRYVPPLILL